MNLEPHRSTEYEFGCYWCHKPIDFDGFDQSGSMRCDDLDPRHKFHSPYADRQPDQDLVDEQEQEAAIEKIKASQRALGESEH